MSLRLALDLNSKQKWNGVWIGIQLVLLALYAVLTDFGDLTVSSADSLEGLAQHNEISKKFIQEFYGLWTDVHVMIFVGFGFLMAFLKTHCWSSIGFNWLIGAFSIQLCILVQGFWKKAFVEGFHEVIHINIFSIIEGEFCAAAVLITFGVLLGKVTWQQMLVISIIESIFFALNVVIFEYWHIHDIGGAMTIHMFGAYFGLAASYFFEPKKAIQDSKNQNTGSYYSQIVAAIGSLFLFIYWPSFNAILASGMAQHRAVVNTFLSISASTLSAVFTSTIVDETGKIDLEVLLNASLSGGVIMGAGCDIITQPFYAIVSGFIMGIITAFGFAKGNDFCQRKFYLHDTCGVQFLHGISGTLGALVAAIAVFDAKNTFPNDLQLSELFPEYPGRSINKQGMFQLLGIASTLCISIPAGIAAGFIVRSMPSVIIQFDDKNSFSHMKYYDDRAKYDEESDFTIKSPSHHLKAW